MPDRTDLYLEVAGERLCLLPERALYWPRLHLLAVADLHWGKAETFRQWGIPVPGGILADDLGRLDRALARTDARRLVILGDLVHSAGGITARVEAVAAEWLARCPVQVTLALGNHDRHLDALPARWPVEVVPALRLGPFCWRHEPEPVEGAYVWSGHVHPMVRLGRRGGVRLPCFQIGPEVGILPAFSAFTGGPSARPSARLRCFGVTAARVVEVTPEMVRGRGGGRG